MKSSSILDHSSSGSVKAQKASMPISRTNGPGYERPERARTSHACEPCRERKTKCDGERPSCRRCLHTGTSCHYGYGKGWRKRKTAEDLNATSKKLQRYEMLLNDIAPLVSSDVRAMIDEARQQDTPINSASEANDLSTSSMSSSMTPSLSTERSGSGSTNDRLPLTLPIPGSLVPPQSRAQPPPTFDRVTEPTSPHLAHHPKRDGNYDDPSNNRLPSITPDGMLIENGARNTPATYPPPVVTTGPMAADPFSTPTGSLNGQSSPIKHADDWSRTHSPPAIRLNKSYYQPRQNLTLTTHVTV